MDLFNNKSNEISRNRKKFNKLVSVLSIYILSSLFFIPSIVCFIISLNMEESIKNILSYISYGFIGLGTITFVLAIIMTIIFVVKNKNK